MEGSHLWKNLSNEQPWNHNHPVPAGLPTAVKEQLSWFALLNCPFLSCLNGPRNIRSFSNGICRLSSLTGRESITWRGGVIHIAPRFFNPVQFPLPISNLTVPASSVGLGQHATGEWPRLQPPLEGLSGANEEERKKSRARERSFSLQSRFHNPYHIHHRPLHLYNFTIA